MNHLKLYSNFSESKINNYSIYEWFEDLKKIQWKNEYINESSLKKWTEHFIGNGWYDIIKNRFLEIEKSLNKIDYEYIYDRLYEIWDDLPYKKYKSVHPSIIYGDINKYNQDLEYKFSGMMSYSEDKLKSYIIHFVKELIYFTSFIGYPSIHLRTTKEQEYVLDEKWKCSNFNIDNFDIKSGSEYKNGSSSQRRNTTTIYDSNINSKKNFNINKYLEMYEPCIIIDIGGYTNSHRTGKFDIYKIEDILDEKLPIILENIDYKGIVWDYSRNERRFSDTEFSDYTLKIILN
jgi:hypothetical protein